jgi:hypothetical protein
MLSLSFLYQLTTCAVGLIAALLRRDVSKDAELLALRHENSVLRRQLHRVSHAPRRQAVGHHHHHDRPDRVHRSFSPACKTFPEMIGVT